MNKIQVMLFGILLLLVQGVVALDLNDLRKDAEAYRSELLAQRTAGTEEQAALLLGAAPIMAEAGECRVAVALRQRAMRLGGAVDSEAWQALAQNAACARNWELATRAGSLALSFGTPPTNPAQTWTELAKALEQRSDWRNDWKPVALEAYRQAQANRDTPHLRQRIAALEQELTRITTLQLERTEIERHETTATICLHFNEELQNNNEVRYGDYIRFTPAFHALFHHEGQRICASGANYATRYHIQLLQGLPGHNRTLTEHQQLTLETGDRNPALWFDRNAYLLMSNGKLEVPLQIVNQERVSLRLLRINERNILSEFIQDRFLDDLYGRALERIEEQIGEEVWRGSVAVEGERNRNRQAWLPLPPEIAQKPGLYILAAITQGEEEQHWKNWATQWLLLSDIALSSYRGNDGLHVMVRSLHSADPLPGVEITLLARNNEPLAQATSDTSGIVHFAPGLLQGTGGRQAVQLHAHAQRHGFSLLRLTTAPHDLSDRGVEGRTPPGPLDAYLYTERGIYRPGETVNLIALLRDTQGRHAENLPLTLRLRNPAGDPLLEQIIHPDPSGGYHSQIPITSGARTGHWHLTLHTDPASPPIGEVSFLVEQIIPPRMEAELHSNGTLRPGTPGEATLTANYLFGAPAAQRPVHAELFIEADPTPFTDYPTFHFGGQSITGDRQPLPETTTDEAGQAQLAPLLTTTPPHRIPLRARLRAEVIDIDGRAATAETHLPIRHLGIYLGIEPEFNQHQAPAQQEQTFRLIALNPDGKPIDQPGVRWRLVAEESDYQWFYKNDRWAYQRIVRERPAGEGQLHLTATTPTQLRLPLGRGDYRLELEEPQARVQTSYRFRAGEQHLSSHDTPDAIRITLDRSTYLPGERAHLTYTTPFPGKATLVIASDRIHTLQEIPLQGEQGEIEIPIAHDWGAGAYALITVYRPGQRDAHGAGRAIGIAWIGIQPQQHQLHLTLEAPQTTRPRQQQQVTVRVSGATQGEKVRLTLAAVDDGILALTHHTPPDPLAHFFGKRRLGLSLHDLYGHLIAHRNQRPDSLRSGGDRISRRGMPPSTTEIVSLFSGILETDDHGTAHIPLNLPDFNGRLRLMAVAWNRNQLGATESTLLVRDPVVVMPSLPRFLALQDHSELRVLLHNLEGPPGDYQLTVTSQEQETLQLLGQTERHFTLQTGSRHSEPFTLNAQALGQGTLHLHLEGPDGYHYQRTLTLNIRGAYLPLRQQRHQRLDPGQELHLNPHLTTGLHPATATARVTLSPRPTLDLHNLVRDLYHYPHGCLEQVTSRAFPLLWSETLASGWSIPPPTNPQQQLTHALHQLLDKQRSSGAFALWTNQGEEEPWLTAYVLELMTEAQQTGTPIPNYPYQRGLEWLQQLVSSHHRNDPETLAARAYGHYVLTKAGQARPEDARYLHDTALTALPTPLAAAQLAAALAHQGDRPRAQNAFQHALRLHPRQPLWQDYGSELRDRAGVIALLAESGNLTDSATAWQHLTQQIAQQRWLSTQEQNWLIRAANTLPPHRETLTLAHNGEPQKTATAPYQIALTGEALASGQILQNLGSEPIWAMITLEGVPNSEPPRNDLAFALQRDWYDLTGKPIDPAAVEQGTLLIALIRGSSTSGQRHRALIVDLLPAGFEIENPRIADALDVEEFAWLPTLSTTDHSEALDDRFVAALDLPPPENGERTTHFTLAYLLRAVTIGNYQVPPAEVEDMYSPHQRARTPARTIQVIQR